MIEDWESELMFLRSQYNKVVEQNRSLQKEIAELRGIIDELNKNGTRDN